MFGDHVHEAVIVSGESISGASVQLINQEYDQGLVLAQETVPVAPGETVASLKKKGQAIEADLYLRVVKQWVQTDSKGIESLE